MNQYERIVSYIHQYQDQVKGANVGYAKIEKRGDNCRIQVQMRNSYINKSPQIYLFKQLDRSIRTVPVGTMSVSGNELYYKGNTEVEKLFGSEFSLDEIDGLLIYLNRKLYFATSWKNDSINLGNWRLENEEEEAVFAEAPVETEEQIEGEVAIAEELVEEKNIQREDREEPSAENSEKAWEGNEETLVAREETTRENRTEMRRGNGGENREHRGDREVRENRGNGEDRGYREDRGNGEYRENREKLFGERGENPREREKEILEEEKTSQIQMQAICGVCPFKRQNMDYGKRILLSFPTMRPFPEEKGSECVRLELQDIGCLPMKYWSLSGNRFLLHGYYCYRHLIFCQKGQGKYVLGVPGIFSDREQKNACRFGFSSFQSIGEFGRKQGAFGYWMMELM